MALPSTAWMAVCSTLPPPPPSLQETVLPTIAIPALQDVGEAFRLFLPSTLHRVGDTQCRHLVCMRQRAHMHTKNNAHTHTVCMYMDVAQLTNQTAVEVLYCTSMYIRVHTYVYVYSNIHYKYVCMRSDIGDLRIHTCMHTDSTCAHTCTHARNMKQTAGTGMHAHMHASTGRPCTHAPSNW